MSQHYENFRENGWKCYHNDPAFSPDDTPNARVISFFIKGGDWEKGDLLVSNPPTQEYTYEVTPDWLRTNLNRVLSYTKKWNDYKLYQCIALQNYLDQLENGGYRKGILSKQEYAMLAPKKK